MVKDLPCEINMLCKSIILCTKRRIRKSNKIITTSIPAYELLYDIGSGKFQEKQFIKNNKDRLCRNIVKKYKNIWIK